MHEHIHMHMDTYISIYMHLHTSIQGENPKDPEELKHRIERFSTQIEQTLVAYSPKRARTSTQTAKTAAATKCVTLTLTLTLNHNAYPTRPRNQTVTLKSAQKQRSGYNEWLQS